ncbi:MAG: nitroreductase family protein [Deltaproteobacteria bacterium]|nr:nitroreductase family protein [Deltaproteobacteria bacterium]
MMTFTELLENRRSIRDFKDKTVDLETIKEILQDSCLAPSASNGQPCQFIIISDKQMMKKLSDESKKNILLDFAEGKQSSSPNYVDILKSEKFNVFYNAPCLIYVVGSKNVRLLDVDCALAVSYIMFSAVQRGLGTCWINLGAQIRDPELKAQIGMPDDCRIVAPVIIGYPKAIPAASERHAPQILRVIS